MKKQPKQDLNDPQPENDTSSSSTAVLVEQISVLKQKISQQKTDTIKAEKKLEMQGQLMATVSHELRTQMGAIMNLVEILTETDLDQSQRQYSQTLKSSASGLLRVLNDVLDHAKIESGGFELVHSNFSPRKIVDTVIEAQIAPCQNKGLALRLEVANDLPDRLYGDALRIRQILSNLANNAVKFTSSGAIDICVSTCQSDTDHPLLEFSVKDTGIGLSEQLKDQLFTPYKQANAKVSARFGGTGLGLSICRQLVTMMEGEIGYSSQEGNGAEFWFNVKCEPYQAGAPDEDDNIQSLGEVLALNQECTGHILIVEDNKTNQMLISTFLEKFDHTFEIVGSGEQALEIIERRDFDAILMDVILPGIDGMQTTGKIRQGNTNAQAIPIIALTANAMSGDEEKYLDAGMDAYISKPIVPADLYHTINKALTNRQDVTRHL